MNPGILEYLKGLLFPDIPAEEKDEGTIFVISDLHLNHSKILRHCHRPYRTLRQMNSDLVRRWNSVVGEHDTVYHLGDFSIRGGPGRWIRQLNGRKIFIRGNHDSVFLRTKQHSSLEYKGYRFYLVHDPRDAPLSWVGWIIHGHTHNKIPRYPFINGEARTINVSCECTGYAPVSLDTLISLGIDTIDRMDTIHSPPERKEF